jgi:predicted transcriptional regulator with HTH domain
VLVCVLRASENLFIPSEVFICIDGENNKSNLRITDINRVQLLQVQERKTSIKYYLTDEIRYVVSVFRRWLVI